MHRNIVCTAVVCIRTSIARLQVQPRDKSISRQPVPTRREKIGHQSVDDCDLRVTNLVTMAAFEMRKRICLMSCIPLCDLRQFLTGQILTNVWQGLLKLFPWWLKKCIANLCQRVIYILSVKNDLLKQVVCVQQRLRRYFLKIVNYCWGFEHCFIEHYSTKFGIVLQHWIFEKLK